MISFILPSNHIMRHFPMRDGNIGSLFYVRTPVELLTFAATQYPQIFYDAMFDVDGRKRLSFMAEQDIGVCNIVPLNKLSQEEIDSLTLEERDGYMVKVFRTHQLFPTKEFHIILGENNTVITMFPGPMAPPLPQNEEISDFWESHAFIKQ